MGRAITQFPSYSQKENITTNYCLLVLKMLYDHSPKLLGEALSNITGQSIGDKIGVSFRQQVRRRSSIPDGLIVQAPVTVYIETKNFDWFYDEQLSKHLESLDGETPGIKVLLALANFESADSHRFVNIGKLCSTKYRNTIVFRSLSFQTFLEAIQMVDLPKDLLDSFSDFRTYLDAEDLLPSWQNSLDVVNCARLPDDVLVGNVYMCPATGGSYSHARSKYFGMYRNKKVEKVALIEAVVDVEEDTVATVKWKNIEASAEALQKRAGQRIRELHPNEYPMRVFLLGPLNDTSFRKDTYGGMQSSKQYFDVSSLSVTDAADLANKLRGKTWSELREQVAF